MARFLTTRGTTSEIETIINNAKNGLFLISPFIKIPDSLFQNLIAADQKDVKITLVYGKKNLEPNIKEQLNQLKNIKLYYFEHLHAKCYFNETSMVITSLNLYDFSEINNREMGVLITRQDDEAVFSEAIREAKMIISAATRSDLNVQVNNQPERLVRLQPSIENPKPKSIWFRDLRDIFPSLFGSNQGYCIGCKAKIEKDEYRPYCPDCYKAWAKDKSQKAKYCHWCGHASMTNINKPLCHSCFKKSSE
jgi:phosphatidylserine/phosphatidylglycerophosphate/cardiolipin synthase-like enzyme